MVNGVKTHTDWRNPGGLALNGHSAPHASANLVEQVESIVRAVLVEMFQVADSVETQSHATPDLFAGQLLGLRDAERLTESVSVIAIAPGTVVTPMARDLLKRSGVAIRWASHGEMVRAGSLGEWGFAIEDDVAGLGNSLRRALLGQEREAWLEVGRSAVEAAGWISESPHRGAVVLTPQASVATWKSCRVPKVRAAFTTDPDGVSRACRHLGANLLILEPLGQSIYSLKQLCATFRHSGVPRPPDGLDEADFAQSTGGTATGLPSTRAGGMR